MKYRAYRRRHPPVLNGRRCTLGRDQLMMVKAEQAVCRRLPRFVPLSFAKMVMGLWPTLHNENQLASPRADARTRR
jgi:hypothetical protein